MSSFQIQKKIYGIIGCLVVLLVPFFLMILNQGKDLAAEQSFCPLKMLTGFPCPGCGITKSIINIYEGNFVQAINFHLFGPIVILFAGIMILWLATEIYFKKDFYNQLCYNKKVGIVAGCCLACYHLIRLGLFIRNNNINSILKESIWF